MAPPTRMEVMAMVAIEGEVDHFAGVAPLPMALSDGAHHRR